MKFDIIMLGVAGIALYMAIKYVGGVAGRAADAVVQGAGAVVTGGTASGAMNAQGTINTLQETLGTTPEQSTMLDLLALGNLGA